MKAITGISMCLVGVLLQGCVGAPGVDDALDDEAVEIDAPRAPSSELPEAVDAKIATVDLPGGQVIFVDEGLTVPGDGIAFWELGDADLSYLLDHENATALEVFLALTPPGTPAPARLVEHHAEVARRVGGIPAEPRRFVAPLALPEHNAFTNEALDTYGSETDKDCWAWAGTTSPYSTTYGYQSFDQASFQSNFNTYSQLSGGTTSGLTAVQSDFPTYAGPTAAGHRRAMAFCLSRAIPIDTRSLGSDCYFNRGSALIFVKRTTDSSYSTYVTADSISLTAFGQGARFRSNYTNSGGGARKYRADIEWPTLPEEDAYGDVSLYCLDELVAAWRSQWSPPLGL